MDGIDDRASDLEHTRNVAQQSCSGALTGNSLHRTAEVKVDDVRVEGLHYLCGLDHRLHLLAVDLDADGALIVVDDHLLQCGGNGADDGVGGHKFCIDHCGAVALAELAESDIRHILHGCKKQWPATKINIAYLHILLSALSALVVCFVCKGKHFL